jgi:hypothetical protein
VDEGPRLRAKRVSAATLSWNNGDGNDAIKSFKTAAAESRAVVEKLSGQADLQRIPEMRSRTLEQQQIVSNFVTDLFPLHLTNVQLSFLGSWLWCVPQHLGMNDAMDLAAESLALAYFAKISGQKSYLLDSLQTYLMSLKALSNAIRDPALKMSSETLCAAMLLVQYEVSGPGKLSA